MNIIKVSYSDDVPDLNLCVTGLSVSFRDLFVNSFLYLFSKSSVKSDIGVEQNSIWFSKNVIESILVECFYFSVLLLAKIF